MVTPQTPLQKVKATRAAEVCERFELEKEARPLLAPDATPRSFLDALRAAGQHQTAACFLAHALPAREAIWWACLCVTHAQGASPSPAEADAVKLATAWVLEPTEEYRRPVEAAASAPALSGTAAEFLALAVSWTGGSLAPIVPDVPPLPPGPYLPAKGVNGAVLLAAALVGTPVFSEAMRLYVDLGVGVAEGRTPWPDVKPTRRGKTWGF